MVKDWGMSEKVGLRTMNNDKPAGPNGTMEQLGPHTYEQVFIYLSNLNHISTYLNFQFYILVEISSYKMFLM